MMASESRSTSSRERPWRWARSSSIWRMRSVSMRPGASVLTVIPSWATWSDNVFDQAVVALRTAFDSIRFGIGCLTEDDVLVITRPQCLARMCGRHSRVRRMAARRFSSKADCQSASESVSNTPGFGPPALLNRMSTPPNRSTVVATTRSRSASWVTSAARPTTAAPADPAAPSATAAWISAAAAWIDASTRENITTLAPSTASARATPLPSPLLAAATIAVFPRKPRSISAQRTSRRRRYGSGDEYQLGRPVQDLIVSIVVVDDAQIRLRLLKRNLFDQHVRIVAEALQPTGHIAAAGIVGSERWKDTTLVVAQQLGHQPGAKLDAHRRL